MWKRYYEARCLNPAYPERDQKWVIVYTDDTEKPNSIPYLKTYRTKKHAERGAERLYRREIGNMEEAIFGK